jgi:hypothetical protein
MAGLVQNRNFVHQRKLSAKMKLQFSKAATSYICKTLQETFDQQDVQK